MSAAGALPRRRFATKLFLAFAALLGVALAVALVALERVARQRAEESFAARFDQTRAAFVELSRLRAQFVASEIESLARSNPQFRTVLSTASLGPDLGLGGVSATSAVAATADAHLRLRSLVPSLTLAERSDVMLFLAADGRLLYAQTDPERAGEDLSALALFQQTLLTGEAAGVWTEREPRANGLALVPRLAGPAVYEVIARPVVFDDAIHGVVIAGARVDEAALATLKRVAGLDLALVAHGHLIASTLPSSVRTELARSWSRLARGPTGRAPLGSDQWVRTTPVVGVGEAPVAEFVLIASYAEERAFVRRMRASLALVTAAILLASLALSFTIARGITTPLRALAAAARRIGAGELETEVRIASQDELGALGDAFNEMTSGLRERDRLRRTFERYVSKEVAAEILQRPEVVPIGGVARELTVAFVDIGGFTALAERVGAKAVVARLNEYFETVCGAVLARDGTVNEFVGDGVVVYWGAPMPQPDHAARACLAALACRDALAQLTVRWRAAGLPETRFRIGLHTGELVVGEIGSEERRAYRAVGDAMNLAARLESANKHYGTHILASEVTRAQAGDAILAREIDRVRVVGRAQPVRLYEPLAPASEASAEQRAFAARWEQALALYRARDFAAAAHAFAALAPDFAAAVLGARARAFAATPPPVDWDGVHALDAK